MRRRYAVYSGRKRSGSGRIAVLSVLFWAVSGLIMIGFIHGGPPKLEAEGKDVAKMYINNIFPTVSRSVDYEAREAISGSFEPAAEQPKGLLSAGQSKDIFKSMMGSMFPGAEVLDDDLAEEDPGIIFDTTTGGTEDQGGSSQEPTENQGPGTESADVDYSKPLVIIYHTHATESYQPVTEGNFHSLNAYGTVREVGDEMTKALEAHGIQVIHDTTIHDSPSYNQSYTRSLQTIKNLMGSNDADMIIVDLHRDAAAYAGNVAMTFNSGNETLAQFSLVVGTGNPNAEALKRFAEQIYGTADEMYPGFGSRIIEKPYKFNQYVCDRHLLLEVGNNQNTIEQAQLAGRYFGEALAKYIKDN